MNKFVAGAQFGNWTVLGPSNQDNRKVNCKCSCGNIKEVYKSNISTGKSISCGCVTKKIGRERMTTHGESKSKLYGVWLAMRRRCYLKTTNDYKNYGARGISVCNEWRTSYPSFKKWSITNGYKEGLTLDRKDNNDNYTPGNCRWVDRLTQGNNKRTSIKITINGITHTPTEWEKISSVSRKTIAGRARHGWAGDKIISPAKLGNNQFTQYQRGVCFEQK